MARYPAERKTVTRERILAAADRVIKAQGAEAASVAEIMHEAGLTVGGFYAHFPSKEALAQEALLYGLECSVERTLAALAPIADRKDWVRALIHQYLAQVDNPGLEHACPMTLLLPGLARADVNARSAFAARTGALLGRIAENFPETPGMSRRAAALFTYTSCVGAVSMARTVASPAARQRIVQTTERALVRALGLE